MHLSVQKEKKMASQLWCFYAVNTLVKCVERIHMFMYTGKMTEFSLLHNDG